MFEGWLRGNIHYIIDRPYRGNHLDERNFPLCFRCRKTFLRNGETKFVLYILNTWVNDCLVLRSTSVLTKSARRVNTAYPYSVKGPQLKTIRIMDNLFMNEINFKDEKNGISNLLQCKNIRLIQNK